MDVWVVVEHRDGQVAEITGELVAAAQKVGEPKFVILAEKADTLLEQLQNLGVSKAMVVESPHLAYYSPNTYTSCLVQLAQKSAPQAIVMGHTSMGWDLAPKVALALDGSVATSVFDWGTDEESQSFWIQRPCFGEKLIGKWKLVQTPAVVTFSSGAFSVATVTEPVSIEVERLSLELPDPQWQVEGVEGTESSAGVQLEEAEVIVSGGRGLKDKDKFHQIIMPLAEALGAAVGASRPVVDDGWLPKEHQVGSSGKVVRPKVYFAIGISGQTQHIAGMKNSECIIAINKDPEAPIFDYAHYGVVADLFEIVPLLTEKIQEQKKVGSG